eukprot:1161300-Pelagomonas_calceolata.AAC.1
MSQAPAFAPAYALAHAHVWVYGCIRSRCLCAHHILQQSYSVIVQMDEDSDGASFWTQNVHDTNAKRTIVS